MALIRVNRRPTTLRHTRRPPRCPFRVQQSVRVVRVRSMNVEPTVRSQDLDAAYRSMYPPLKRLAYLLTRSDAEAEDVVQDVFIRCESRLSALEEPAAYLWRAVINACHSYHRQLGRRRHLVREANPSMPVELVELRDALSRLRPKQRTAVVLRYYGDLSFDEIAQLLGCRPATVRSLIHRAIIELREVLS